MMPEMKQEVKQVWKICRKELSEYARSCDGVVTESVTEFVTEFSEFWHRLDMRCNMGGKWSWV